MKLGEIIAAAEDIHRLCWDRYGAALFHPGSDDIVFREGYETRLFFRGAVDSLEIVVTYTGKGEFDPIRLMVSDGSDQKLYRWKDDQFVYERNKPFVVV